jgi:pilus assembly protein Flp/PilA
MSDLVKKFLVDENGATAIEYALLASLIALAIIGSVAAIAPKLSNTFNEVSSNLK